MKDAQKAHSSNQDDEQCSSKMKKTLALDTFTRKDEKLSTPKLAKLQALELAIEELRKGKLPLK